MNGDLVCVYCGKPAEGNYSVHRDGFGVGPEVPLCDACGEGLQPTLDEIWARIGDREMGKPQVRRFTSAEVAARRHPSRLREPKPTPDWRDLDAGLPPGFREIQASVYTNGAEIVVCAHPDSVWPELVNDSGCDEHPHNCDAMGCNWEHVIARAKLEVRE